MYMYVHRDAALQDIDGADVSFVGLLRALYASPVIQADVTTVPKNAVTLLSGDKPKAKRTLRKSDVAGAAAAEAS